MTCGGDGGGAGWTTGIEGGGGGTLGRKNRNFHGGRTIGLARFETTFRNFYGDSTIDILFQKQVFQNNSNVAIGYDRICPYLHFDTSFIALAALVVFL